jgi:cullin-4
MIHLLNAYQSFYTSQFKGRKLIWRNSMGSCVLKANFPKGRKEISVSLFQAVVLMLFNDTTNLTLAYSCIANETKLGK